MNLILAQTDPRLNFWNGTNDSVGLWAKIIIAFVLGVLLIAALTRVPPQFRRVIVTTATFIAGFFYIALWLWPEPIGKKPGTLPNGAVEWVGFNISDAVSVVGDFYNILATMLLGLGVFSVLRIHLRKFVKKQQDWGFSAVLLAGIVAMVFFGYANYLTKFGPDAAKLADQANWGFVNYGQNLLFDGMLQQMDAAMFSIIAFYILSAAYRAFRIRSVEATILLATALIVILSLMGLAASIWGMPVDALSPHVTLNGQSVPDPGSFTQNFRLENIAKWLTDALQTSSLRGIDFGVGIGTLAMGMRLWLSLEKGGVSQ
ncbi:MAG TPA: hypothetical protein VHE55_18405 [Fimbriimonadaceae bacterium]|nr:hypothetical protein [Fimbriimonadaceae bacterium]